MSDLPDPNISEPDFRPLNPEGKESFTPKSESDSPQKVPYTLQYASVASYIQRCLLAFILGYLFGSGQVDFVYF